eukprot:COSAG01_NODE_905_length_12840_cov_12.409544_5_plen_67_part_00
MGEQAGVVGRMAAVQATEKPEQVTLVRQMHAAGDISTEEMNAMLETVQQQQVGPLSSLETQLRHTV